MRRFTKPTPPNYSGNVDVGVVGHVEKQRGHLRAVAHWVSPILVRDETLLISNSHAVRNSKSAEIYACIENGNFDRQLLMRPRKHGNHVFFE